MSRWFNILSAQCRRLCERLWIWCNINQQFFNFFYLLFPFPFFSPYKPAACTFSQIWRLKTLQCFFFRLLLLYITPYSSQIWKLRPRFSNLNIDLRLVVTIIKWNDLGLISPIQLIKIEWLHQNSNIQILVCKIRPEECLYFSLPQLDFQN